MATLPGNFRQDRPLAWFGGQLRRHREFAADVHATAQRLPVAPALLNLCDSRYRFMVALAAAAARGQVCLLPASPSSSALEFLLAKHPGSEVIRDRSEPGVPGAGVELAEGEKHEHPLTEADAGATAVLTYTSGSTGAAHAHAKSWAELRAAAKLSSGVLAQRAAMPLPFNIVATVPPQHMYGLEFSVMLPLAAGCAVHDGRPMFFADVAQALNDMPVPRVLLTTPFHLGKLLESGGRLPELGLIVSATAPLQKEMAVAAESRFGTTVCEVYGCTEAGSIATRRTALDEPWRLHPGLRLEDRDTGVELSAPHFATPVRLDDSIEILDADTFRLLGRAADLVKVAGKRGSLRELTQHLLDIPGVQDAVVFIPETQAAEPRPAALVAAPGLQARDILAAMATSVDPVFLPRPLRMVDALPRDRLGKLPRAELIRLLHGG